MLNVNLDSKRKNEYFKSLSKQELNFLYDNIKDLTAKDIEIKISEILSYEKLNYFNEFRKNILSWYDFKKDSNILEIGANLGDITLMLSELNFSSITAIEFCEIKVEIIKERLKKSNLNNGTDFENINVVNLNNIDIKEKYDYISLIGIERFIDDMYEENISVEAKFKKIINFAKDHLNENGTILVSFDNYLGIKNFSYFDENGRTKIENISSNIDPIFTQKNVLKLIKEISPKKINNYYPFPNYINSDIIISEKYDNMIYNINNYNESFENNVIVGLNEKEVLKNIVKSSKEYIKTFANSIFMEIDFNESNISTKKDDIKFISFNNVRKSDYRLITIIRDEYVEKKIVNKKSNKHFENMKNIITLLEKNNINKLDIIKDNKLFSKYISKYQTLDLDISDNYDNDDYVINKFNLIKDILLKTKIRYDKNKVEYLIKIIGVENENLLKELTFVKYGFWDMVPKNCFNIDGELYFFDQEWMNEYLPVEFIIYRGVLNSYDYVKKVDVNNIYLKLGIDKYINIFEKIDASLRKEIIDENIISKFSREVIRVDDLKYNISVFENELKENDIYINSLKETIEMYENENVLKSEYIINLEKNNLELKNKLENTFTNKIKRKFDKKRG